MTFDPLEDVEDKLLAVTPDVLIALRSYRLAEKLELLPGEDPERERAELAAEVNRLVDGLLAGLASNPNKKWVMAQFQKSLVTLEGADTEAREHFGMELESIMDILGIESSDGLLSHYLGGL